MLMVGNSKAKRFGRFALLGLFAGLLVALLLIQLTVRTAEARPGYITFYGDDISQSGTVLHPYGATIYPYFYYNGTYERAGGWTKPYFTQYIDSILNLAQQGHMNTLRLTDYLDGTTDPYNSTVWANIDYFMTKAAAKRIYVLLDLSTMRNMLKKQGVMPYDASKWNEWLTFVGQRYRNTPNLLNYAIAGEVDCPNWQAALRPPSTTALTQFYSNVSTTLYQADGGRHLISTGGFLFLNYSDCGIDWKAIFSLPHINLTAVHVYSDSDRSVTVPMVSAWATAHHKPFTIEEFGFPQGSSDSTRAVSFQNTFDLATQYRSATSIFWNLGTENSSGSHDVGPQSPLTWNIVIQNAPK